MREKRYAREMQFGTNATQPFASPAQMQRTGTNGTVAVVCGRNEQLRNQLSSRDWDASPAKLTPSTSRRTRKRDMIKRVFKRRRLDTASSPVPPTPPLSHVDVIPMAFVSNMDEWMAAASVLVTKAGPGTIAEAAAMGLPVLLTSFLPGQEAGNVDVVLEGGFGDYVSDPVGIARTVVEWVNDENMMTTMAKNAESVGAPDAAKSIVEVVLERALEARKLHGGKSAADFGKKKGK